MHAGSILPRIPHKPYLHVARRAIVFHRLLKQDGLVATPQGKCGVIKQRTIKNSFEAKGVGLHTGEVVLVRLRPAAPGTGVVFRRTDLDEPVDIPARVENVVDTTLSTTLGRHTANGMAGIATVEHLMSAIAAFGIDNIYIDLDGGEVPIMDGSASSFVFMLQSAGIEEQQAAKKFIRIRKEVCVSDGDKWEKLLPHDGFKVSLAIDFDHPVFRSRTQKVTIDFSDASYIKELSRARTFGFKRDYEKLRANNLAKGGSLFNAVVVDDYGIVNEEGLRFDDEFVKHKALDVIGDLYLLGNNLVGAFEGYKAGHFLNNRMLVELLADADAWEEITYEKEEEVPVRFFASLAESHS